jgi:hypothetical protein
VQAAEVLVAIALTLLLLAQLLAPRGLVEVVLWSLLLLQVLELPIQLQLVLVVVRELQAHKVEMETIAYLAPSPLLKAVAVGVVRQKIFYALDDLAVLVVAMLMAFFLGHQQMMEQLIKVFVAVEMLVMLGQAAAVHQQQAAMVE